MSKDIRSDLIAAYPQQSPTVKTGSAVGIIRARGAGSSEISVNTNQIISDERTGGGPVTTNYTRSGCQRLARDAAGAALVTGIATLGEIRVHMV